MALKSDALSGGDCKAVGSVGGPVCPSPTIAEAINGGYPWLEVRCSRCKTMRTVDLAATRRPHDYSSISLRKSFFVASGRRLSPFSFPPRMITSFQLGDGR